MEESRGQSRAESPIEGVVFDLGGVVLPSPFEAFDDYGRRAGLPDGFVRAVIRASSERGAWAALERGELTMAEFGAALEDEARAAGHPIVAAELMAAVAAGGGPRPQMLVAIEALRARGVRTAALTNNWRGPDGSSATAGLAELFHVVVESVAVGLRKPDPRIYELTLERLGVPAHRCAFLDDLGINLKPARAMGMATVKVVDPDVALAELSELVGFPLDVRSGADAGRPGTGGTWT